MIIVLGNSGMLGRYVYDYMAYKCGYRHGIDIIGVTRSDLDATDLDSARDILDELIAKDDVIINCMGVTNKRSDLSISEMYMVNSIFPHLLDRICARKGAHLIHPSTDCVYNGKSGNYSMEDHKDEEGDYGLSKSIGEELYGSVIRVSIIGEEQHRHTNLIGWCQMNKGESVNGYTNHYWNGITCLEWVKLVDRVIREQDFWSGVRVYQSKFRGMDFVNKADLVECISQAYDLSLDITPVKTDKCVDRSLRGHVVTNDLQDQIIELAQYKFGVI